MEEKTQEILRTLSAQGVTDNFSPQMTIRPTQRLSSLSARVDVEPFTPVRVLGEGGMGRVLLARQTSLQREVAIKELKPEERSEVNAEALLQEALVTGSLEHPNIIPVHSLERDAQGSPRIVMKRVEGTSWDVLLQESSHLGWGDTSRDPLTRHIQLLIQVCNAVHFAHSCGYLHLDLKPENVMLGSYGEVYVLDWGSAQRLDARVDSRCIAGTLAYIAPEMLFADERLTPKTDVYLLGAILYEILLGRPPHTGKSLREVIDAALREVEQEPPASLPTELVEVCRRALRVDPSQRFESALSMRRALEDFLQHRSSLALSRAAGEKLIRLQTILRRGANEPREIYDVFGECRFGFDQALREWPENKPAFDGREAAFASLCEHEIAQRNLPSARSLLNSLLVSRPDLAAKIDSLAASLAKERDEVERLRADAFEHNARVAALPRSIAIVIASFVNLVICVALSWREAQGTPLSAHAGLYLQLFFSVAVTLFAVLGRRLFLRNIVNWQYFFSMILLGLALFASHLAGVLFEMKGHLAYLLDLFIWALLIGALTIWVDRRFLMSFLLFAAALVLGALAPPWAPAILGFTFFVSSLLISSAWLRGGPVT